MANADEPEVNLPQTIEDQKERHRNAGGSATPPVSPGDIGSAQNQGAQGGGMVEGDGTGQPNTRPEDRQI